MLETIKSYLVSLGFAVDKSSYHQATKAIDAVGHGVAKFAGGALKNFAIAEAAVASFVVVAAVSLAKFLDGLGKAQIENEKLARQMWTTEENAQAFNSTLKALAANLQDLYLSPTLMDQFQQLRKEAFALQAPAEYKNQMQLIQSISFEFKRMKLEGMYALQWIGYYFIKYMSGPILQVKLSLSEINDKIVKTMQHCTKVVAQVMSWFAQFGITALRAVRDLGRGLDDLGQGIPKNLKLIGAAIAALGLILKSGPIGILITAFTLLILLLDDFYTYLDGGESQFGPFWEKIVNLGKTLKDLGLPIDEIKAKFQDAMSTAGDVIDSAKAKVGEFFKALQDNGTIDELKQSFSDNFSNISTIIQGVVGWIERMFTTLKQAGVFHDLYDSIVGVVSAVVDLIASINSATKKFLELESVKTVLRVIGDIITAVVAGALETVSGLLKEITSALNVISKLFKGDFKGALKTFGDILTGDNLRPSKQSAPSYIYPQSNTNTSTSNKVTLNQTNNIYGSDAKATADAAQDNFKTMMYHRNLKGVFLW